MKRTQRILLILALALMVVLTYGCVRSNDTGASPSASTSQSATPTVAPSEAPTETPESKVTVKDSRGVELTFDKVPEKVISLIPSDTEIFYALGLGDKLIGVSEYCNYPEDTANKQKIPTGQNMNIESLIAMKPDLLLIGKMSVMDDQIKQMEDAGVRIVVTEANSLAETYEVIELLGTIMGKKNEATDLVNSMKKGFEDIKKSVEGKTPVSVYVEVSPLQYGLWSCGKNTFIQELIDIVGATNIFSDLEGWASVSEEQVLQRNPQVILTTSSPLTGIDDPVGEIKSRANWSNVDAVKNGRVLMLDGDMITRPGPRLLDAGLELVKAIYP